MAFDVSIIVPVYGVEEYVGECVRSVMAQSAVADGVRIECLIVDDCGTDGSMKVVENLLSDYDGPIDFRVIVRTENGGLSAARNTGIREAKGEYVYFLDSDDIITPDCIRSLVSAAKRYPDAELIIGDFQTFPQKDEYKSLMLEHKNVPEHSSDVKWLHSVWFDMVPEIGCNKLVKLNWITEHSLYFLEGVVHEDTHWHGLLYSYVNGVAFVKEKTYLYRMRTGSIMKSEGFADRRVRNLGIIYSDLFSKKLDWDRPLVDWAFDVLTIMKFGTRRGYNRELAREAYRNMRSALIKNRSISMGIRCVAVYNGLPRLFMRRKVMNFVFDKIISI